MQEGNGTVVPSEPSPSTGHHARNTADLISVRGWSADLDPRYPGFVERLRTRGFRVHDLFVSGNDMPSWAAWADALMERIDALDVHPASRRFVGYCLGGHLMLELASRLDARGEPPRYLGLIDVRDLNPLAQVREGIYRRYRVPWTRRIRHHARLLAGPDAPPSLRQVLQTWYWEHCRAVRNERERRSRPARPREGNWHALCLAYGATFPALTSPVYLYNTSHFIAENDGDLTLGLAPLLRGGYALRIIDETHLGCVDGDRSAALIDLILADLGQPAGLLQLEPAAGGSAGRVDEPPTPGHRTAPSALRAPAGHAPDSAPAAGRVPATP